MIKEKAKLNEIFFFIAYTLYSISITIQLKFISPYCKKIILYISPIFLMLSVLQKRNYYKRNDILISLILVGLLCISYFRLNNSGILFLVLFIVLSKNINFRKLVKYDFIMKIIISLIVISLYFLGVFNDGEFTRTNGLIRNALGFEHPNALRCLCFIYMY